MGPIFQNSVNGTKKIPVRRQEFERKCKLFRIGKSLGQKI